MLYSSPETFPESLPVSYTRSSRTFHSAPDQGVWVSAMLRCYLRIQHNLSVRLCDQCRSGGALVALYVQTCSLAEIGFNPGVVYDQVGV